MMDHNKSRWLWVGQALSGIALVLLLGLHWIAQHYLAQRGLRDYAEVSAYLKQPLAYALETAFLATVTAHALLGLRAIFADLGLPARQQRAMDIFLCFSGILTMMYGLQLTWQIVHP